MTKENVPKPTESELSILRVLWQQGPSTVRAVLESLVARGSSSGYTTVLKLLQIMTEKGLVLRDESQRAHVYRASSSELETQQQIVGDLLDRAFGGSAGRLALQALSTRKASREELEEIRHLIDELEGEDA